MPMKIQWYREMADFEVVFFNIIKSIYVSIIYNRHVQERTRSVL